MVFQILFLSNLIFDPAASPSALVTMLDIEVTGDAKLQIFSQAGNINLQIFVRSYRYCLCLVVAKLRFLGILLTALGGEHRCSL